MTKPVILIVDDEQIIISMLGGLLHQEYRVLVATNGDQALKRAQAEERPDLILLDVIMPDMDGYEVCRRLKEDEATRDIPVIFLTANSDEQEEAKGFEVGALDYINKPVRPAVVMARVRTHLKLKQMHEVLQRQNKQLEQAAQLRDDVDLIMRHDLKTPLNSIIAIPSFLMNSSNLTEADKKSLQYIEQSGHNMLAMINRSLDLYKMETGTYQAKLEPFDLMPILKNTVAEVARSHAATQKSWCLQHHGEEVAEHLEMFISGESMLCYPMFSNLLQNAFEASPQGGRIEIDLDDQDKGRITVSITNTGAVPEKIRDRFFDKYVTAGKQHGTGLGTYSARLCAETQNGSIRLELPEKNKTRVVVELESYRAISVSNTAVITDNAQVSLTPLNESQCRELTEMLTRGAIQEIFRYLQTLTERPDCPEQAHELLVLAKKFKLSAMRSKLQNY